MSRRMDREGVERCETQRTQNMRFWDDPRCKEDERGWVQPFTNWQGWQEFNRAAYALRCVILFRGFDRDTTAPLFTEDGRMDRARMHRGMNAARIEGDMHTFRFSLERSRKCDRPALP